MAKTLYLEDEEWTIGGSIKIVLEIEFGHHITICEKFEDADRHLRSEQWDVIVVDIMLNANRPIAYERSAFQLIEAVRGGAYSEFGNNSDVPIVIASGVWEMMIKWKDGKHIPMKTAIAEVGVSASCCVEKPLLTAELNSAIGFAISARMKSHEGKNDA